MLRFLVLSLMLHIAASFYFIGGGLRLNSNPFLKQSFLGANHFGAVEKSTFTSLSVTLKTNVIEDLPRSVALLPPSNIPSETLGLPMMSPKSENRRRSRFHRRAYEPTMNDVKNNARCYEMTESVSPECNEFKP